MTAIILSDQKFKFAKYLSLLFFLQILAGAILIFTLYILTDILKLLPKFFLTNYSSIIGLMTGSTYFGYWMEKKYPGILCEVIIKKLSVGITVINFLSCILILAIFVYLKYIDDGKAIDWNGIVIAMCFMAFALLIVYFATKSSVVRGVKSWRTKQHKKIDEANYSRGIFQRKKQKKIGAQYFFIIVFFVTLCELFFHTFSVKIPREHPIDIKAISSKNINQISSFLYNVDNLFVKKNGSVEKSFNDNSSISLVNTENLEWYRKAAANDSPNDEYMLGLAYYGGTIPSPHPVEQAKYWFKKAAAHGIAEASVILKKIDNNKQSTIEAKSSQVPIFKSHDYLENPVYVKIRNSTHEITSSVLSPNYYLITEDNLTSHD